MSIELTPQQQQALDTEEGGLLRIVDPRNNAAYVLVNEVDYEAMRDAIEEERCERAIRAIGLRNAAGRMGEAP
jgi:hypothetical protein